MDLVGSTGRVSGIIGGTDTTIANSRLPQQQDGNKGSTHSTGPPRPGLLTDQIQTQVPDLTPRQVEASQLVVRSSDDAIGLLFSAAEEADSERDHEDGSAETNKPGQFLGDSPFSVWSSSAVSPGKSRLCNASAENISLWSQHRFVRQGWFSAREAITYIDL